MKIIKNPKELQRELILKKKKHSIGFVPTMGGLHQGHFSLIDRSQIENDFTVVSIFLNPTQFDNKSDLATYPASLDNDINDLKKRNVDILFTPTFTNIYPDNYTYEVLEKDFSKQLCGSSRPGHFNGVLTIVLKLLNIVNPTRSYFGEKDFQQLKLIKNMVSAFFLTTEIINMPTVRDSQGLALSSRNKHLSPEGMEKAHFFARTLKQKKSLNQITEQLQNNAISIDYIDDVEGRRYAAVNIENVRLIDNVPI